MKPLQKKFGSGFALATVMDSFSFEFWVMSFELRRIGAAAHLVEEPAGRTDKDNNFPDEHNIIAQRFDGFFIDALPIFSEKQKKLQLNIIHRSTAAASIANFCFERRRRTSQSNQSSLHQAFASSQLNYK